MKRFKIIMNLILLGLSIMIVSTGCSSDAEKQAAEKLYLAISFNNIQACEEALRDGNIDLEKLPKKELTELGAYDRRALALAIDHSVDHRIIQMLIDHGADVNSTMKGSKSYLTQAVLNGDYELCKMLLDAGADAEQKQDGNTAIDELFACFQLEDASATGTEIWYLADYLIERGGTLSENTLNNYIEAEGYACIKELIEQLEEQNTELSVPEDQFYAMTGDNEKLLEYLSDNEPSDEEILIKYAAANCNVEVLKLLKPYSSNFNYVDENGQTLLHIAAKFNTPEVVKYFIEQGADLHAETEFYMWNALSMAVLGEKAENVQLLLDEGMTWQCEGPLGGDTWIAACMAGSGASIEMLLEYGFDPTPEEMVYGYENCNDNTFKTLLKNNISYTEEYDDYSGVDALVAIHPQYAKEVFENDPDIEITPEIIEYAITSGNDAFAVKVIDLAKDLNVCFTMTPLETAVVSGNMELVEYLIQRGADINSQIEEAGSHTVMHTAAENLSTDILKYLLEQGGDTQAIDSEGLLPEDRAEMAGLDENYELLAQ